MKKNFISLFLVITLIMPNFLQIAFATQEDNFSEQIQEEFSENEEDVEKKENQDGQKENRRCV